MNPDYSQKTVLSWMNDMYFGALALTDFQRSRVWENKLVERYLKAILTGQPTGTLLMVEPGEGLNGRAIDGNDADISEATTLILDGQQRLTSLWHGLTNAGDRSYYIKVNDIEGVDLQIHDVFSRPKTDAAYATVAMQYSNNVIPIQVLYDPPDNPPIVASRLEDWCVEALPDSGPASTLRRAIEQKLRGPLEQYVIWYAKFTGIGADEAVKIFVESNLSSVRIKAFDLAVARAVQIRSDIKFRLRVASFRDQNDRVKHYFSQDQDRWIPDIGEYLLKTACLKIGKSPKDANFEKAVEYLFDDGTTNADAVEESLNSALQFLEDHGVPTKDFIPRVPPIYVIAALQSDLDSLHVTLRAQGLRLIIKYYWWSFFSDRYSSQANDKLHQDYLALRHDLQWLQQNGELQSTAPIFDEAPLTTADQLIQRRLAFRAKSPLGRAITALSLDNRAKDWVTGEEFTPSTVRELESENQLDRHHVFPRKALTQGEGALRRTSPFINHGVNIVLLSKRGNINLGGSEPDVYLHGVLQGDPQLTHQGLENRINSHIAPYGVLREQGGSIRERFEEFLRCRAKMLTQLLADRV